MERRKASGSPPGLDPSREDQHGHIDRRVPQRRGQGRCGCVRRKFPEALLLAQAGLRAFVISGNLGQPDGRARYDLPPAEIERFVAGFIAGVSKT